MHSQIDETNEQQYGDSTLKIAPKIKNVKRDVSRVDGDRSKT
jgi:hypothetical protein